MKVTCPVCKREVETWQEAPEVMVWHTGRSLPLRRCPGSNVTRIEALAGPEPARPYFRQDDPWRKAR
jgi:hypothetical protein